LPRLVASAIAAVVIVANNRCGVAGTIPIDAALAVAVRERALIVVVGASIATRAAVVFRIAVVASESGPLVGAVARAVRSAVTGDGVSVLGVGAVVRDGAQERATIGIRSEDVNTLITV
jgi:hypothetical protein